MNYIIYIYRRIYRRPEDLGYRRVAPKQHSPKKNQGILLDREAEHNLSTRPQQEQRSGRSRQGNTEVSQWGTHTAWSKQAGNSTGWQKQGDPHSHYQPGLEFPKLARTRKVNEAFNSQAPQPHGNRTKDSPNQMGYQIPPCWSPNLTDPTSSRPQPCRPPSLNDQHLIESSLLTTQPRQPNH